MTASIDPSRGGWWAPIAVGFAGVSSAAKGYEHYVRDKNNRALRFHDRQKALHGRKLTPGQYVLEQTADKYSPQEIKQQLRAWGGEWKGVSFADSSNFEIVSSSSKPGEKISNYELSIRRSQNNLASSQSQNKSLKLGCRGGATEEDLALEIETHPSEISEISEIEAINAFRRYNNTRELSHLDQCSHLNPVFDISSNKGEEWETFTFTIPDTPFIETPQGRVVVPLLGGLGSLLIYIVVIKIANHVNWGKLFRRFNLPDGHSGDTSEVSEYRVNKSRNESSDSASKFDGQSDVQQGSVTLDLGDPTVKALMKSDSLLKVLTAFSEKKISKAVALSLLKRYHNQTEEEASSLLEERRPSPF